MDNQELLTEQEAQAFMDSLTISHTPEISSHIWKYSEEEMISKNKKIIRKVDAAIDDRVNDIWVWVKDLIAIKAEAFRQIRALEGKDDIEVKWLIPTNITINIANIQN